MPLVSGKLRCAIAYANQRSDCVRQCKNQYREKIIGNPPDSAEEAVYVLIKAYYSDLPELYGKKLIREVYSAGFVEHSSIKDEDNEGTTGIDNIAITVH